MEFFCICVDYIGNFFILFFAFCSFTLPAFSSCIINPNPRLHIVDKHMETDFFIFHRSGLHNDSTGYQVIAFINRCHTVQDMMIRLMDIICYLILKREHSLHIKISCSCDKIFFIRILSGKLKSDQMRTIIQIFPIYTVILHCMPSRRLDHAYFPPFLSRHDLLTDIGISSLTAPQCIQIAILFKSFHRIL